LPNKKPYARNITGCQGGCGVPPGQTHVDVGKVYAKSNFKRFIFVLSVSFVAKRQFTLKKTNAYHEEHEGHEETMSNIRFAFLKLMALTSNLGSMLHSKNGNLERFFVFLSRSYSLKPLPDNCLYNLLCPSKCQMSKPDPLAFSISPLSLCGALV
jgi:hypothetical protein